MNKKVKFDLFHITIWHPLASISNAQKIILFFIKKFNLIFFIRMHSIIFINALFLSLFIVFLFQVISQIFLFSARISMEYIDCVNLAIITLFAKLIYIPTCFFYF